MLLNNIKNSENINKYERIKPELYLNNNEDKVNDEKVLNKNKYNNIKNSTNSDDLKFYEKDLKWINIILITIFHAYTLYCFLTFPFLQHKVSFAWGYFVVVLSQIGVTAGAHRFWTHRSFKANLPARIIMGICYSIAGMNPLFEWIRDHRIHHKYSETDADPHNSTRGFFFSHVGWLMTKKHPEVIRRGKQVDMSDILADPVAMFVTKYHWPLYILLNVIFPVVVPVYFWNEEWHSSIQLLFFIRYSLVLNGTWSVNSLAHMYGSKPYDVSIAPVENGIVSWMTGGEGWHNYHHTFPYDHKTAEFPSVVDNATFFIQTLSKIGWTYDLKEPSPELIKAVIARRTGKINNGSNDEIYKKEY